MARTLIRGNTQIQPGTITNAEIDATAGIELSKIENGDIIVVADGTTGAAADLNMGGFKVVNAAPGTDAGDLVTKAQLDSVSAGLDPKESCRLATTGPIDLTTGGLLTIDGVVTVAGDRVLVKDQTSAVDNGIYVAAAGAWTRAEDFDGSPSNEVSGGSFTFIEQGTNYAGSGWVVVADGDIVVGTDPINWTLFSSAGSYLGGAGIDITGNTISVDHDGTLSTSEGTGTQLGIADSGVDSIHIAADAVTAAKINADVAGLGITQAAGGELDVNVDGSTLTIIADTVQVADGGIDSAQIATGAVDGSHIADNSIDSNHIVAGAIDSTHLSADFLDSIGPGLAGDGLGYDTTTDSLFVNVDGSTIEITADSLNVVAGGIGTTELADDSVTAAKINADVAGLGLTQAAGGELDVNVDGSTLTISADTVQVADSGITATQLASSAFGFGLIGGDGTAIAVDSSVVKTYGKYTNQAAPAESPNGVLTAFTFNGGSAIVSGSEMLFLNGILMHEGASNDYTINYSTGVVTFTFAPKGGGNADKILMAFDTV